MRNEILWQQNFEKKVYKQRRRRKKHKPNPNERSSSTFSTYSKSYFSCQLRLLNKSGFIDANKQYQIIEAPKHFSFKKDHNGCISLFKQLLSSFVYGKGHIVLNFQHCQESTIASFSLLEVFIVELSQLKSQYNRCRYCQCNKEIKFIQSQHDIKTNKYLHAFFGITLPQEQNDGSKYLKLVIQTGKKRNYHENTKSKVSNIVTKFVNDSAQEVNVELRPSGKKALGGMLGEVLGNAEDHCSEYSRWFVDGISFSEKQHGVDVVDLNIAIVNFGPSMFEGFEETKTENSVNYSKCQKLYEHHKKMFTPLHKFEKESLFTMYMLNEGISRLKYKDESRGNGTMKFLQSFISLGSFGDIDKRFKCQLNIISGHTVLTCDNEIGIFEDGGMNKICLNKEKEMRCLPDKDNLAEFSEKFPGTILECHIYLNKDYFYKALKTEK